jgi:prephenate dehydrogenase
MVLVAVPLNELDELFGQIAEDLKPGTLVFTIGALLQPAIELATKQLPAHAHCVAGHPVLTGLGAPAAIRADLFEHAVFALAASVSADAGAVQLASDFVERVGATPLFVDALEHDGIVAGVEQLPQVMAAALMRVSTASPGWREARRLAGRSFAASTHLGGSAAQLFRALQTNRQNLVYRIRQMQQELGEWVELLEATPEDGAPHPLLAALEEAVAARSEWEAQAVRQNWEEAPETAQASAETPGFLRQMFFGNLGRRGEPRK